MCVPHQKYVLYVSCVLCVCMWHPYVWFERSLSLEPEQRGKREGAQGTQGRRFLVVPRIFTCEARLAAGLAPVECRDWRGVGLGTPERKKFAHVPRFSDIHRPGGLPRPFLVCRVAGYRVHSVSCRLWSVMVHRTGTRDRLAGIPQRTCRVAKSGQFWGG